MRPQVSLSPPSVLKLLAGLLIVKIVISVFLSYADYLPPNFQADFLLGREGHFYGGYSWAFYTHIFSGPLSLILGMILISQRFRRRWPWWHRRLGRAQVLNVIFLVTPSGLWMSRYAITGDFAGAGFASLAIATAFTAAAGWRSALRRNFAAHECWMWRCFILLCSAVTLRVIGGVTAMLSIDADWPYQTAAWMSWLAPLALFELWRLVARGPSVLVSNR